MALRTIFKYGVPFSFVYCTIYQQNIWREGDERLVEEQKRVWRDFFKFIDDGYHTTLAKLNLTAQSSEKASSLVSKFDYFDVRSYWNNKVQSTFGTIDKAVSNPMAIACKAYRKVQPYVSSSSTADKAAAASTSTNT